MSNLVLRMKVPKGPLFSCPVCQKGFNTAKALGGHKLVHVRRDRRKQSNEFNNLQIANLDMADRNFTCPVCTQGFTSARSVSGHMKKHSSRNWRGMRLPPAIPEIGNAELLALDGPQQHYDCHTQSNCQPDSLILPGWTRSGKRRYRHGKAPMIDGQDSLALINREPTEEADLPRKRRKLEHRLNMRGGPRRYACDLCDRSFKSYQALGGHKSHHTKMKRVIGPSGEGRESGDGASSWAIVPYVGQAQCSRPVDDRHSGQVFRFDLNELPPEWEE